MTCTHEIWDRETAVADGFCPLCMSLRIEKLELAIRWALGELPDSDGQWFGESRPEENKGRPRPFWWRKNLRRISRVDAKTG